jgi:hypothetical protein
MEAEAAGSLLTLVLLMNLGSLPLMFGMRWLHRAAQV